MSDELVKPIKIMAKPTGLRGLRANALAEIAKLDPEKCPNRFAIGFDNSGSMGIKPLNDAKTAVANFLANCQPSESSISIYPFDGEARPLTCDYSLVNTQISGYSSTGSTPLFETCEEFLNSNITRGIVFSDGQPDSTSRAGIVYSLAKEKKIPIDTVYIGEGDSDIMKELAEMTGGIYLSFKDAATMSSQLKYLAPRFVALLANAELKKKIEAGETI